MTIVERTRQTNASRAVVRAVLPWCLLFVAAKPLLGLRWLPPEWSGSFLRWLWFATSDIAFILPFLAFAGGVALKDTLGYSRRVIRAGLVFGIVVGTLCYSLGAWVAPVVDHLNLAGVAAKTADARSFGPRTPRGILDNLRFVEANPPDEYSLRLGNPERSPPNILRWELHLPLAIAVFGLVNVFLGVLSAELTIDLKRGRRRNALMAIGLAVAILFQGFQVVIAPIAPFTAAGTLRSGTLAAWLPLVGPLAGCVLLTYLVRSRRYG